MRDPKRIKLLLAEIERLWLQYPDWRFGQLMSNLFAGDSFHVEDDLMLTRIKQGFQT